MRLKKLTDFVRDHTVEPRPTARTVRRWPGAQKVGGEWYIDMDVWQKERGLFEAVDEDFIPLDTPWRIDEATPRDFLREFLNGYSGTLKLSNGHVGNVPIDEWIAAQRGENGEKK